MRKKGLDGIGVRSPDAGEQLALVFSSFDGEFGGSPKNILKSEFVSSSAVPVDGEVVEETGSSLSLEGKRTSEGTSCPHTTMAEATKISVGDDSRISDHAVKRPDGDSFEAHELVSLTMEEIQRFPELAPHQSYASGSVRAKLVQLLNRCLGNKRFPRARHDGRQIDRAYFARKLGFTSSSMRLAKEVFVAYEAVAEAVQPAASVGTRRPFATQADITLPMDKAALHVVSIYPDLLKHQHYPLDSTARAVVQILNGQLCDGGLRRSRGGKIDRTLITTQLGLSRSASIPYVEILLDYESSVGGKESLHETRIPDFRAWFEAQLENGTMEVRDGRASRTQFYAHFNLPGSKTLLIRYPRIQAVIDEIDQRIQATGYLPRSLREKVMHLNAILLDDPPIGKDGLSVNRNEVARILEIDVTYLARAPFVEVLAEADLAVRESVEQDRLTAFIVGRIFRFSVLLEQGWPEEYAIRVKGCFERHFRTKRKDDAKTFFAALVDLFSFLAGNESQYCRSLLHGLGHGVPANSMKSEFTKATQEYRDHLRAVYENTRSCNGKIATTNSVIRRLGADSLLPTLTLYLIQFRNDKKVYGKTVAEAVERANGKPSKPHVC